jgi:hypothetical protein
MKDQPVIAMTPGYAGTFRRNMSSPVVNPTEIQIKRDGKNQEYVDVCGGWVRITLVMFEDKPHLRIQEYHALESDRLHLGPLVPLEEWASFVDLGYKLAGPYVRQPRAPLARRTLSGALDYEILGSIAILSERRRQNAIGGWGALVRDRLPETAESNDLLFAFKRLWKRGLLRLTKPDGREYSGDPSEDGSFFFTGPFNAEVTADGWNYWESLKGKAE